MKDMFDVIRYRRTAMQLAALDRRFNADQFLAHVLDGLENRELVARLQRTAEAFHLALPVPFAAQLNVLRAHAPQIGHGFVAIWPCAHVANQGLDQPALALPALRELTCFGSAEFAIRAFLIRDPAGVLAVMRDWAEDKNEHVRRLASEGCRPRLPWGTRLQFLVSDPSPAFPILEKLRIDPSLYVRKSVANHLNDICKDHPDRVLDLVSNWDRSDVHTAWIIRQGVRTLVKRGNPRALALLGADVVPKIDLNFSVRPARIRLGDKITFAATLSSTARRSQSLLIDYVVHYARASGGTSPKVFKWKQLTVAPGASFTLIKSQTIRDFSTRRHYAGKHRVELQINGRRLAEAAFTLST